MKTISDGAVKLLKEYAARPQKGLGEDPLPTTIYSRGVDDGVSLLAEQLLDYVKESE
jgi:hypothetical protein